MWSLAVVARSYRAVLALVVFSALWYLAAYEWLGLPESSLWLLILAFIWAVAQILAGMIITGGSISGAADVASTNAKRLSVRALWLNDRPKLLNTLAVCLGAVALALAISGVFAWINDHAINVASYLTFHAEKPVSHMIVERVLLVMEGILSIALAGFFISFLISLYREGWAGTWKALWKLLAGCLYRAPFFTSLVSAAVFGGAAYSLITWHPKVPAGFWDYTQVISRFSLALILRLAGGLFWVFALARLYLPKADAPTS
jgi:hypothetical protein